MKTNKNKYESIFLRPQLIKDAKTFYKILKTGCFDFFPTNVNSIKEEKEFIRKNKIQWEMKKSFNFSIIYNETVVGAIGIIKKSFSHIIEIGYFIDKEYWNKGIASQALIEVEKFVSKELPQTRRIEIILAKGNIGSMKVAEKCKYEREGLMKSYLKIRNDFHDAFLYSKIL